MTAARAVTGIAWSPRFADHPSGRRPPYLAGYEFLPDEGWDGGDRVQCLRDIVSHVALPGVAVLDDPRPAEASQLLGFHTAEYLRAHRVLDSDGAAAPDEAVGAALLGVGAVLDLCRRIWAGTLRNGYALVRPAGHHSEPGLPGGGCLFANGVLAAVEARRLGAHRILIVDWDAHHGNSQQGAFWRDPDVLTISVHQARAYQPGTGGTDARGGGPGRGANLNVPVPMGSGGGVYRAVFERVIHPAAERFRPDMVLVASGLDGNYLDPSARLALHSGDYAWMTTQLMDIAARYAGGRLLMTHEGGYSRHYLPLCFLRIVEALSGHDSGLADPFLRRWGTDFAAEVGPAAQRVVAECADLAQEVPHAR